jgi:hypothetical protein
MGQLLRLSEHLLSQQWLAQFHTSEDRNRAAQLLNQLKLVSTREFEAGIERVLTKLQSRLNTTIAVYPVTPLNPKGVLGYHPFEGGIVNLGSSGAGRREQHGSEGRVAHILTGLQRHHRRSNSSSMMECTPTIRQVKTQKIRHIVLVDDVVGSGRRIAEYWKQVIPKSIKSLLSLKRCELWIVVYAITPLGRKNLTAAMPNFPLADHLISVLPTAECLLTTELSTLCSNYAELIGMESSGLGYQGSACPTVFEHGCPNNLPAILWANKRGWKGLFPNRSIPPEMRSCFDEDGMVRAIENLWQANQHKLALILLESLDHAAPLDVDQRMLLTLLGLRLRGVSEADLAARILMSNSEYEELLRRAEEMGLYDKVRSIVTPMGKEVVSRFRERFGHTSRSRVVAKNPVDYYPWQCEGKLRELGKTGRGNSRSVPMEPK